MALSEGHGDTTVLHATSIAKRTEGHGPMGWFSSVPLDCAHAPRSLSNGILVGSKIHVFPVCIWTLWNNLFANKSSSAWFHRSSATMMLQADVPARGVDTLSARAFSNPPPSVSAACRRPSPSQLNTSQCDVHGKRKRADLGKDFDLPCVLGAHLNVHVLEGHVLQHNRSCLTENAGHRVLCGSGALHPLRRHAARWHSHASSWAWQFSWQNESHGAC